jgi:hypothetical protein
MTIVCLGKVLKCSGAELELIDQISKQKVIGTLSSSSLDIKVGTEGIFVGEFTEGKFTFKRVNEKKFLSPLYEEELIKISSIINLYDEIQGPFDEWFKSIS